MRTKIKHVILCRRPKLRLAVGIWPKFKLGWGGMGIDLGWVSFSLRRQ